MNHSSISVNLIGGSTLTRDLFSHILSEAGINTNTNPVASTGPADVALVIAEAEDPSRLLTESAMCRAVVIADGEMNDDSVVDLVLEGADAIIDVQSSAAELTETIQTVAGGGTVLAPGPARRLVELARDGRVTSTPERALLTGRELDILLSIGRGESVKQTARTLGISAKTVENLQSRLFRKLDVRNRAQAFAQAHALGMLPLTARVEGALRDEAIPSDAAPNPMRPGFR